MLNEKKFQSYLKLGNHIMLISGIALIASILLAYGYDAHFSLMAQVAAHISTVVFAAVFKVAYVIRCIGAEGLGHASF
ncbi:hypothetical protein N9R79_03740 [Vibrio sp.]|nr:hypothetical protein [Vibrio sp.]